jgi:RNA polymerase sigma factor (sigma-70 family)
MIKEWALTQDAFDQFLQWLDPDREQAGSKYEAIRRRLIRIFTCRGCQDPEDLADETINRVARKVQEINANYVGDPALYFYGVARNVYLEHVKKRPAPLPVPDPDPVREQDYECLEKCLAGLTPANREMVLDYYRQEKQAKIDHRKLLAQRLGIAPNALRIRLHRVRAALQECMDNCLKQATIS